MARIQGLDQLQQKLRAIGKKSTIKRIARKADPYNNLDDVPSCDRVDVQIDVYATDDDVVSEVAKAVRNAIETECYVTRYGNQDKDPVTGMPHYSFDVSWHVNR